MRILFLAESLSPHISRWHSAFKDFGWEVMTASCDFDDRFTGHRLVPSSARGPLRYLSVVGQVKSLINEFRPLIINAHFLPSYGLAAALANVHPMVLTLWGSDIFVSGSKGLFRKLRSKFVLRRSDLVVGDAQCLLDAAAEIAPLKRQLLVSFGIRKSWYESGEVRELSDQGTVKIISCRRFEKVYDIKTLINAARLLSDQKFPFELSLVGTGSLEGNLRSMVKRFGLEQKVTFTGAVSDSSLFSLYRNSDIYVSTARSDSTSVSLLEAMSQKLYPVVTDIAGNREWLESERFLFEPGSAAELAEKIKCGTDPAVRAQAYEEYKPILKARGIREEQMKVAELAFRKLIEQYRNE